MTRSGVGIAVVLACLLAGCTVGPKYKAPDVPITPAYKEADGWKAAHPSDQVLRGSWWEIFGDSQLNALEEQVPGGNQNLKRLEARFREARAAIRFNRASEFPTVSTSPSIASIRNSANRPYLPAGAARAKGDFVLPFDVSYELDFWGRVRRTVASAREFAQASPPTSRQQSSVFKRNWRSTISSSEAPTRRSRSWTTRWKATPLRCGSLRTGIREARRRNPMWHRLRHSSKRRRCRTLILACNDPNTSMPLPF